MRNFPQERKLTHVTDDIPFHTRYYAVSFCHTSPIIRCTMALPSKPLQPSPLPCLPPSRHVIIDTVFQFLDSKLSFPIVRRFTRATSKGFKSLYVEMIVVVLLYLESQALPSSHQEECTISRLEFPSFFPFHSFRHHQLASHLLICLRSTHHRS